MFNINDIIAKGKVAYNKADSVLKFGVENQSDLVTNAVKVNNTVYAVDGLLKGGVVEKVASVGVLVFQYDKQPLAHTICSNVLGISRIRRVGFKRHFIDSIPTTVFAFSTAKLLDVGKKS